jgi:hypothetical protein
MTNTAKACSAQTAESAGTLATEPGFGGLVEYFGQFVPAYLKKTNGNPVGRRRAQIIAKQHNLPLVRLGNAVFIDPNLAARLLIEAQTARHEPRGPGRPRKGHPK